MGTPSKVYPDQYVDEPSAAWKADQPPGKKSSFKLGSEADEIPIFKFHAHGGKRDWVQYLGEEANHKKVQDIRRKWRERHWRARNLDKAPPLFTFRQEAIDPAKVRASPPEVSSDELDQFTSPPRKRKTRSRAKTANTRQDSVLAPSPDDSSDSEKATQGRRKRRRPN